MTGGVQGMPVACGALGGFDPETVAGMERRSGVALREVHRDGGSVLLLDRDPSQWSGGNERGVAWPERFPDRIGRARSWREAAAAGACGLVLTADGSPGLHASGSGVGPLYWTGDGGAVYFATDVDALVAATPRRLRADWESWASILVLGFVPGHGTPFDGVSRVPPLTLIAPTADVNRDAPGGDLAWTEAMPGDPAEAPERIVSALRAEIEGLDSGPIVCPLSGGFDSRLLACLLAEERRADLTAWTVNIDQGNEREETFAAAVAAELGIPHRVVTPPRREFGEELADAARRVDHESLLHLEMARLVDGLPKDGVVVDGLAGDVLIKGLFLDRDVVAAPDWHTALGRAFDRLVSADLGEALFEPRTWRAVRAGAREAFCAEGARFAEHPSGTSLSLYWTRTRRGVATSPTRIFGAHRAIAMPFLADEVARASLSAPLEAKLESALYRPVLEFVNPRVAALPSSNDPLPPPPRTGRPLGRSREARQAYRDLLERSPLRPWFSGRLEAAIRSGKLGDLLKSRWLLPRVHYLCSFTLWAENYGDRLDEAEPGEPFPTRPG